jgi:NADPH:quinone reductase-like Zn-dependent oxidoreductase
MAGAASRIGFKVVAAAVAIPVGRLVTKATTKAWATARPDNPPVNPNDLETGWTDALIWAGLTGVGAAVAQLLASKGADTVWRAMTGKPSPKPKAKAA